jgi:hypothetical protein
MNNNKREREGGQKCDTEKTIYWQSILSNASDLLEGRTSTGVSQEIGVLCIQKPALFFPPFLEKERSPYYYLNALFRLNPQERLVSLSIGTLKNSERARAPDEEKIKKN